MNMEYKLNRLDTSGVGPLVDKHWRELREAKEKGMKVAWSSGPMFIYAYATPNITSHFMAGYAAYCGGRRMGDEVLEAAERYGELRDTCSYHRLHTGMAAMIINKWPVTDPRVILPLPDLLISGRFCTEMSHYMEAIHRRFGTKAVIIELPVARKKEDLPRIEKYVTNQIKDILIPAIEQTSGSKFNGENMRNIFRAWKGDLIIRNKCWEFFKRKPALWTLWDYGVSIAPIFYAMGKPESHQYFVNLLAQLEERAAKNIPAVHPDGEKYRLYWDGWLPWAFLGKFLRLMVPHGAIPISGRYPWEFFPYPEDINPEADDIIHEWIRLLYTSPNTLGYHDGPWGGEGHVEKLIQEYSVDGMLFFSSKTCRLWNLGQQEIINKIERKYGIPGIVIEGDMVDSSMVSEDQLRTRIEALLETIDARRK